MTTKHQHHRPRVAIYARVSTDDKGQDPENQLREFRQWCQHAGHPIVREYVEHESGRNGTASRKQLAALMDDASRRQFDLLLFWSIDRFSREGMVPTVMHLQRLHSYGVRFHSYTEPYLATDNELARDILLSTLASLAKLEAKKISERTKAGMARVKEAGKHVGRPPLDPELQRRIAKLWKRQPRPTVYRIAQDLGISFKTVSKYVRELEKR